MYLELFNFLCILALFLTVFLYKPWKKNLSELDFLSFTSSNFKKYAANSINDIILIGSDVMNSTIAISGTFSNGKRLTLDSYANIYNTTLGSDTEFLFFTIVNETGAPLILYAQDKVTAIGAQINASDTGLYVMSVVHDPGFVGAEFIGKTVKLG
jgi:hypothetical protein